LLKEGSLKRRKNRMASRWGSVRPYTYHSKTCKHCNDPDHTSCNCAKWLYEYKAGEKPRRYTLNTPSWAEALEKAADVLRSFDPEISTARKQKEEKRNTRRTVLEAIQLWLDRTANKFGDDSSVRNQYRSTFGWIDKKGRVHGTLLGFVTEYNAQNPESRIEYIDQITPLIAQTWHDSHWFAELSPVTRRQRWGTVRSFFAFLHSLGVIPRNPVAIIRAAPANEIFANVPFAPEQYASILQQADWYVDERVKDGEREIYCQRMHAFVELLRRTGMDLVDAVSLRPKDQIAYETIDDHGVPVLRYRRTKTKVEAVIPLLVSVAKMLERVPESPTSVAGIPFRYKHTDIRSDVHNWSRRVSKLFSLADVTEVQLVGRDGRPAVDRHGDPISKKTNPKMLRHTAAVGWLAAGMREEAVAKMLGHSSTEMVRKHYGPWCKQRDDAHIREVLLHLNSNFEGRVSRKKGERALAAGVQ
jgi:integrase